MLDCPGCEPTADMVMTAERELRQEIAALEHELRRVRDGLERNPTRALERRARELAGSIDWCRRELESLQRETRS